VKSTLLCLATKKGHEVLKEAVACGMARSLFVSVIAEPNTAEPFDAAIRELALSERIMVVPWSLFRDDPVAFLAERNIGAIMCIGWRYLIPRAAIEHLSGEVVVAHDSLLPKLRGFAPLPTALIAGEEKTGVTFLRPGAAVDDGDVLWQGAVAIAPTDTIADLIDKVCPIYREGARRYFERKLTESVPQDHSRATYSIWRDELDYRIDWTRDAVEIERTIRALGPPYLGAQALHSGQVVVVRQVEIVPDLDFAIRQPGKIWSLDSAGRPTVVCGSGLLKITVATTREGASILPIRGLRQRFS